MAKNGRWYFEDLTDSYLKNIVKNSDNFMDLVKNLNIRFKEDFEVDFEIDLNNLDKYYYHFYTTYGEIFSFHFNQKINNHDLLILLSYDIDNYNSYKNRITLYCNENDGSDYRNPSAIYNILSPEKKVPDFVKVFTSIDDLVTTKKWVNAIEKLLKC